MSSLTCKAHTLDFSLPLVMGILNLTPDSFSDGGRYNSYDTAIRRAQQVVAEGADVLDIGGESTRPNAAPVSVQQELDRVIPIIEKLKDLPIPISIDTSKAIVMKEAIDAGASIINDTRALTEPGALEQAIELEVPVCLMHMKGTPTTMQAAPSYDNVVKEVYCFLQQRITNCVSAGLAKENIIADPGFGFGKQLSHNYTLLKQLDEFKRLGVPLLVGLSRKKMIGDVLELPADKRVFGSLSAAVIAAMKGANILRVHDVRETVEALKIVSSCQLLAVS